MHNRYGDTLPAEILNRYLSESAEFQETDIIVYFDLLHQIKAMANKLGEHIRIKGGTGASFVAFVLGATEINPLRPHYFCPYCHKIEFDETVLCGWDLPVKQCSCGREYLWDSHNLPFEALRYALHKNVHFDLSVSHGLYRAVKERLGTYFDGNTIVTLIRKGHPNLETIVVINEEISGLTNGQELPFEEYYDRLRQYATITLMTDEDLDSFRLLEQETKTSFENVDFACQCVLKAFQDGNTEGIPEFRTDFLKTMVNESSPATFHDLIQILGLSHGTGVWFDNIFFQKPTVYYMLSTL